jgi:protein TonB
MNPSKPVSPQAAQVLPVLSPTGLAFPDLYATKGGSSGRALAFGAVIAVHIAAGWGLLQIDSVRTAVKEASPIFVDLIAPPEPPPPPPPLVKPPPPAPRVLTKPPPPPPILTAKPSPAPAPFEAPPPPPIIPPPAPPAPIVEAPPSPPAPPPAPPAPPPQPKTVAVSAVRYLKPPAPVYPAASKRMRESGQVVLRVLVSKLGVPESVTVQTSSGHARLDEAAASAVRESRFQPYTENGVALEVWVPVPIEFVREDY